MPQAAAGIDRVMAHRLGRESKVLRVLERRRAATLDDVLAEVYDDVPTFMHGYARMSLLAHAVKLVEDSRVLFDGERYGAVP